MTQKKIPMRMCAICRKQRPKKELVRLVKTPGGQVLLDDTGKKPGRGFYVCPEAECIRQALKSGRLNKAIGQRVDEEILDRLKEKVKDGNET